MPKYRILRDKQNKPDPENDPTDHTTVNRTNNTRHGGSKRIPRTQQKRKHIEDEPEPPTFHAGIQKNRKVAIEPHTRDMRNLTIEKPNVMTISNPSNPVVTFKGPREAFRMKPEALNILDKVLENVKKIPIPQQMPETQQVNQQGTNSLAMLNAAIREIEGTVPIENAQQQKETVAPKTKKVTGININAVRIGAAKPNAIDILNAVITKPEEDESSQSPKLTTDDQYNQSQSEYHEDILNYMKSLEIKLCKPRPCYMDKQPEVTGAMRSQLVDWLIHIFQGTNDKMLHMTVNYVDTFLSRMSVVTTKFQLLVCAAGLLACKTEDVYIRNPQYWVILGGETFTRNQLLMMEQIIKSVMKFELRRPTTLCFIRHICFIGQVNAKDSLLANYLSELVLIEGDVYLHYSPSLLASAIIALARHTLDRSDIWPQKLIVVTHHTPQQLLPLFALLRQTFNNARNNQNSFVYMKYTNELFHAVAKLELKEFNPEQFD